MFDGEYDRIIGFVGVRICEIFSKRSSLNERARRANFVLRKLPLWPEDDGVRTLDEGVVVPLSVWSKNLNEKLKY